MRISDHATRLLLGLVLLSSSAYLIWRGVSAWKPMWQQREAAAAERARKGKSHPDAEAGTIIGLLGSATSNPAEANPNIEDTSTDNPSKPAEAAAPGPPAIVDHSLPTASNVTSHFLHRKFPVKSYQGFGFTMPAHSHGRVHGNFKSFAAAGDSSQSPANVDVLLLSQREFSDFIHRQEGTATFAIEASNAGVVDWAVHSSPEQAQRYYLVFRNSPDGLPTKIVEADFTLSFD
ncbi:MAG: hypothetical protein JOY93_06575 [Acidobacteriales bacterium]|nr:hypothetical protein [Terriglobales bacterium]